MAYRVVQLESTRNSLVQEIRQAAASGRPTEDGLLIAEGPHLVEELLRSSWTVKKIVLTSETFARWEQRIQRAGIETIVLPRRTFSAMAPTEATQGVLALARPRSYEWRDVLAQPGLVLVLDSIQDPGNAGTMIRSAEAFGAAGVILLRDSVRIANQKLMRASAGSLFRVPFLESVATPDLLREVQRAGFRLVSRAASGGKTLEKFQMSGGIAFVTGSEGGGVSPAILTCSETATIQTAGVESLNAAVACSIALYELARRRNNP
jgi:RNA methyltransferase, TrmH family